MKSSANNCSASGNPLKILVFDQDSNLGSILQECLITEKYDVDLCHKTDQASALYRLNNYVACLIVSQDTVKSYFDLVTDIKAINDATSIIFIGYHPEKEEVIAAYHHYADDFIRMPIGTDVIKARLYAILKRTCNIKSTTTWYYKFGAFTFDLRKQILSVGNKSTRLTTKECEMLQLLCENANQLVKKDFILKTIWKSDSYFSARSMDVYITKLRHLLKDDPTISIINVHGKGYKLITK
ncbi:response regulator transcription factor [Parabacteroides provencensis]|uniref:response regulator transcription factor n=1 Tax=Parabacteroides provencensis TaxID=1944636 RepID=UPI000C1602C9|nr:response regulator transcription factor [Parabacteroides provencensis]